MTSILYFNKNFDIYKHKKKLYTLKVSYTINLFSQNCTGKYILSNTIEDQIDSFIIKHKIINFHNKNNIYKLLPTGKTEINNSILKINKDLNVFFDEIFDNIINVLGLK